MEGSRAAYSDEQQNRAEAGQVAEDQYPGEKEKEVKKFAINVSLVRVSDPGQKGLP